MMQSELYLVKARAEKSLAPFAAAALRTIFQLALPETTKKALWLAANRQLLHHSASVQATDILGNKIICRTDDIVQKHIAIFGLWEPTLTQHLLTRHQTGGIFLDIGANIGYFSLLASRRFDRVIAFEPSPSIHSILVENLAANQRANVKAHRVAISDKRETLRFYRAGRENIGRSSLIQREGFEFEADVECVTLQDYVREDEWPLVKFIKIDVEGAEGGVFASLMQSHHLLPPDVEITIETNGRSDPDSAAIFQKMIDLGYAAFDLQSTYELADYLSGGAPHPRPIDMLPDSYTDCLFMRPYNTQK